MRTRFLPFAVAVAVSGLALVGVVARAELATQPLSPTALLNRCYTHLTQKKLPPNSPYLAQVLSGAPVTDVCLSIFDRATLQAGGGSEGMPVTPSQEASDVLRTMHAVHQAWFPNDDLFTSAILCSDFCVRIAEVHDATEARLHLTRAALTPGVKYQEIVTGTSAMEAVRASGARSNNSQQSDLIFQDTQLESNGECVKDSKDNCIPRQIPMDLVQLGALAGIRRLASDPYRANATTLLRFSGQNTNMEIHKHFGGGILGTQSYLALNLGLPDERDTADGGKRVARRWGRAVFHDFLCRDVPVIRPADAATFVQTTTGPDTPAFRTGQSCMGCHASMDPLAGVARNLTYLTSNATGASVIEQRLAFIHGFTPTMPVQPGITDRDPNFHLRPPSGRLVFRDFRGTFVNVSVNGIPDLGAKLAATDDLYVCAASRYYQYFTGINVKLTDPQDPGSPALTAAETYHRNLVIQLGTDLRNDPAQSVRNLFRAIWNTEVYRRHSPRGTPN